MDTSWHHEGYESNRDESRPAQFINVHLLSLGLNGSSSSLSLGRNSHRLGSRAVSLALLQVRKATSLVVDIANLLIGLSVESTELLARRVVDGLLEVVAQSAPACSGLLGNLVVCVQTLGALSGVELLVEVAERGGEALGESVLLVQVNSTGDGVVTEHVAVGKVLGDNARAGLVLLGDVVIFALLFDFGSRGTG